MNEDLFEYRLGSLGNIVEHWQAGPPYLVVIEDRVVNYVLPVSKHACPEAEESDEVDQAFCGGDYEEIVEDPVPCILVEFICV